MCEFKVGDEVVCVSSVNGPHVVGAHYTVAAFVPAGGWVDGHTVNDDAVQILELPWIDDKEDRVWGFAAYCFRKVQRRDLNAWLATKNAIEGPVRGKVRA